MRAIGIAAGVAAIGIILGIVLAAFAGDVGLDSRAGHGSDPFGALNANLDAECAADPSCVLPGLPGLTDLPTGQAQTLPSAPIATSNPWPSGMVSGLPIPAAWLPVSTAGNHQPDPPPPPPAGGGPKSSPGASNGTGEPPAPQPTSPPPPPPLPRADVTYSSGLLSGHLAVENIGAVTIPTFTVHFSFKAGVTITLSPGVSSDGSGGYYFTGTDLDPGETQSAHFNVSLLAGELKTCTFNGQPCR